MNDEALTITKEAVLKAAAQCSTAKDILRTLFPAVFPLELSAREGVARIGNARVINTSDLYTDAFLLHKDYEWRLESRSARNAEDGTRLYLVPELKKEK